MKTRKLLALIMTIALALSLFACGASEAGKDTPPFSKVSLDCSEDDVVKAYISATIPVDWEEVQLVTSDGVTFAFDHNDLDAMSRKNGSNESTIYYIGDTMYRNGLAITLSSAKLTDYVSYSAYSYFEPDPGEHFLILFFDITNTLNQPQKIKWLYNYDTFIDDYADNLTYFIGTEIDGMDSLYEQDGTAIPSGKSMSGYMVVKVPDGWNKVELQSRQGTFEINSSDFQ